MAVLFALAFSGCCVAERCDCPNQAAADDIVIRFSREPAVGFTQAETQRLVLIRQPVDTTSGAKADSLILDPHPVPAAGEPDILLRRGHPFTTQVIGVSGYRYVIRQLADSGVAPAFRYELRDVVLASRYTTATACCTCYENVRKELRVDNGPVLDLHVPSGSQPATVELRKR